LVPAIRDGSFVLWESNAICRDLGARQSSTDPEAIAADMDSWNRHMRILDAQLRRTGAFATGARFTRADIVPGLSTHRWFMTPIERPALPAVVDYYERSSQRPACMAHDRNGVP
jgi:glutathione S-transferase